MANHDEYLIPKKIFSPEVSSLIANILSDAWARRLEFGANSVMNMPVQTAVKTGTSTDYKDAWVAGFNDRYVVGIWMGNLDRTSMNGVTGSTGPALVLRGIFSMLNQHQKTAPLYLSPKLIPANICMKVGDDPCFSHTEYFISGTEPHQLSQKPSPKTIQLISPTDGLQIAIDPRIPADKQRFKFQVSDVTSGEHVQWILNGSTLANTQTGAYLWLLARGTYLLQANISLQDGRIRTIPGVTFVVK
jgi:penicillin-binding protein 1C